jgi:hypothetical protein
MTGLIALRLLLAVATAQTLAPGPSRSVTCVFSNPAYPGWCRASDKVPAGSSAGSVCQSILACLNNVQCIKTYCNATQIRGGWRLESVRSGGKKKST